MVLGLGGATLVSAQPGDGAGDASRKARGFAFLSKDSGYGYVARWNPCQKVKYRINPKLAPKGSVKQTKAAVRRLTKASGLRFKYLGKTKKIPTTKKVNNYGGNTNLVIAWTTPKKSDIFQGTGYAGYGGAWWNEVSKGGKRHGKMFEGYVLINKKVKYPKGFGKGPAGGYGTLGQLLMHELGHATGLAHVQGRKQIMYPYTLERPAAWGPGDKKGLKRVGKPAGCLPGPSRVAPGAKPRQLDTHTAHDSVLGRHG